MKVINTLKKALPYAWREKNLDMSNGHVYSKFRTAICGTPHCHGGWYALVSNISTSYGYKNFHDGMDQMNKDLGIPSVLSWALKNPDLWGNNQGGYMFSGAGNFAFASPTRPSGAKRLQDIIDHWKEVYERLVILEKKESIEISNPPITAEELMHEVNDELIQKQKCNLF